MHVHGFQSSDGSELKVYTLELVSEKRVDPDTELEVLTPAYLVLALLVVRRLPHGLDYVRGTVSYDVKKDFELSTHTRLGLFSEEEAQRVHAWAKKNGRSLVTWMRRCPVAPSRGRTWSTPAE